VVAAYPGLLRVAPVEELALGRAQRPVADREGLVGPRHAGCAARPTAAACCTCASAAAAAASASPASIASTIARISSADAAGRPGSDSEPARSIRTRACNPPRIDWIERFPEPSNSTW